MDERRAIRLPTPRPHSSRGYSFTLLHLGTFLLLCPASDGLSGVGVAGVFALSPAGWVLIVLPLVGVVGLGWSVADRARERRLAGLGILLNSAALLACGALWMWLLGGED